MSKETTRVEADNTHDIENASDEYVSKQQTKQSRETTRLQADNTYDIENASDEYVSKQQTKQGKNYTCAAAIHLGTTSSTWAFSFLSDFIKDPLKIMCRKWHGKDFLSSKAPTTILVREDGKTLDSFGYEAEDKYAQFAADDANELHTWYYFKTFKVLLHDRKIRRDTTLESQDGKVLPALRVFAMTIKYLMKDLLEILYDMTLEESLIRWVLTVPAIWDEPAKQLLREAAVKAGIPNDQLILALEPEAVYLYCTKLKTNASQVCPLDAGTKFLLIDARRGYIDFIAFEVMSDGSINEINWSNCGACGSTDVDEAFIDFLNDIFGKSLLEMFKQKYMDDYAYMLRYFETRKRLIEPTTSAKITLNIPKSLTAMFENQTKKVRTVSLKCREKWSTGVIIVCDKMRLDANIMKRFYAGVLQKTSDHLKLLFSRGYMRNVNTIMMVGGFSESKMLQDMVRNLFPDKRVIVPENAGLSVLKGATLIGHEPSVLSNWGKSS